MTQHCKHCGNISSITGSNVRAMKLKDCPTCGNNFDLPERGNLFRIIEPAIFNHDDETYLVHALDQLEALIEADKAAAVQAARKADFEYLMYLMVSKDYDEAYQWLADQYAQLQGGKSDE